MANNNDFGRTIAQLRKEKGLAQKELAEKLGVSDKAVSRWETGKNYPDIETLQRLAEVLEVSVDELLSGELRIAKKSSKRKKITIAVIIAILIYMFPLWHLIPVTAIDWYSAHDASYLICRGLPTNRLQVSHIIKTAREALSDVESTQAEAYDKYGKLGRYAMQSDIESEVVSEKHILQIWSIILNPSPTAQHRGYMWVCYSQSGFDKDGNMVSGVGRAPALWYLDKDNNGEWYVSGVNESP